MGISQITEITKENKNTKFIMIIDVSEYKKKDSNQDLILIKRKKKEKKKMKLLGQFKDNSEIEGEIKFSFEDLSLLFDIFSELPYKINEMKEKLKNYLKES